MLRLFPFWALCVLRMVVWLCGCVALFPGCGVALLPARSVDLRARGEGVVEYLGKVACPSGRRCSTRNAVWCHSHPGFKSQRYRHCRPAPLGPGGFVMPTRRVWAVCGAAGVAGWCRWCSGRRRARPPARLGPHFVRRRASKPARALRSLRRSPHWRRMLGASSRSPARPRHRPRAPQPGPPHPPALSTPVGPGVLLVGSARRLEAHLSPQALTSPIPEAHPISHVIPPRPFQILKSDRCNCNILGVSRKMTTINYVRHLAGGGVVAARGRRSQAL